MSHDTSSTTNNPHIPNDYNPLPSNFQAPAHNLNKSQVESVVELAERTGHEQGSHGTSSTTTSTSHSGVGSGLTGSGSGLASGGSHGLTGSGSRVDETGGYSKTAGEQHSHGTGAGLTGAGVGSGLGRDRDDQYETSKTQQDTSNRAPGLGTDSRVHQHQLNSIPGVGDAAPKPGKANVGGTNDGKTGPPVAQSGSDPAAEGRLGDAPGSEYPEQRHAGKAGLGPHYHENQGGIIDKVKNVFHGGQKHESEQAVADDKVRQDPLRNPVAGDSSLSGDKSHLNPDDSKGLASKRLGEDSTTLGSK